MNRTSTCEVRDQQGRLDRAIVRLLPSADPGSRRVPGGDGGALGGVPPDKGVWGAPQVARRRRRFFGAFLTDFHEVLLLFLDLSKPKNGYKYSHSSC